MCHAAKTAVGYEERRKKEQDQSNLATFTIASCHLLTLPFTTVAKLPSRRLLFMPNIMPAVPELYFTPYYMPIYLVTFAAAELFLTLVAAD